MNNQNPIWLWLRLARFKRSCKKLPAIKVSPAIVAAARLRGIVIEDRK